MSHLFRRNPFSGSLRLMLLFSAMLPLHAGLFGELRFTRLGVQDGLTQTTVTAMVQDPWGYMWIATLDGLNRYDGYGVRRYKGRDATGNGLADNDIRALCLDGHVLWIGLGNAGVDRLDTRTGRFSHYGHGPEPGALTSDEVRDLVFDDQGRLWVATFGGGLNRMDADTQGSFSAYRQGVGRRTLMEDHLQALHLDGEGFLWIGYATEGFSRLDTTEGTFTHFKPGDNGLPGGNVRDIVHDAQGRLWLACYGAGLSRYDPYTGAFLNFRHGPGDPRALPDNWVKRLLCDGDGRLWVGTANAGLALLGPGETRFTQYRNDPTDPTSLSFDDVRSLFQDATGLVWVGTSSDGLSRTEPPQPGTFSHVKRRPGSPGTLSQNMVMSVLWDRAGTLWVGTLGGGLDRLDPGSDTFTNYRKHTDEPAGLPHNWVMEIYEDPADRLWLGTHGGLTRMDRDTGIMKTWRHDPDDPTSLSHDDVYALTADREGTLWVGTQFGGLCAFNPATERFRRYPYGDETPGALSHYNVNTIFEDVLGRLWVGTMGGLNLRDPVQGDGFVVSKHQPNKPDTLPHNAVRAIAADPREPARTLWIGTSGGLSRYDTTSGRFRTFRTEDGLSDNTVYALSFDGAGTLWMSTNMGLSRFSPTEETFTRYDVSDGLQSNEFNQASATVGPDGYLVFGGINGLTVFQPEAVVPDPHPPRTAVTELFVNGERADGPEGFLARASETVTDLNLTYQQRDLTFRFAGLHFAAPQKHRYAYRLEGFRDAWVTTDAKNRSASYTNLDAGRYSFQVKSANKDGVWSPITEVHTFIPKPPWARWWALCLYGLALSGLLWWLACMQRKKWRKMRDINARLRQLDRMKDTFLANTSHELRTPLNGIIGLAESVIDGAAGPVNAQVTDNMRMVVHSGKRLATLVNDILDLSQLKNQGLVLRLKPVNLHHLTGRVLALSAPLASRRGLTLEHAVPDDLPAVQADPDRLEQIMHNLVGNAVKFTETGFVRVSAALKGRTVTVTVKDTGIGIAKELHERIFQSFERGPDDEGRAGGGTGLGLALTRQLVQLHGSSLALESRQGKGAVFSFTLPVSDAPAPEASEPLSADAVPTAARPPAGGATSEAVRGPATRAAEVFAPVAPREDEPYKVLVVDDEPVNRQVLHNHLIPLGYVLTMASSGREALDKLKEGDFDIVLLDIMMPGLSGYEVCARIRETLPRHVLPVIFLSARNQMEDVAKGFECGANDYLTKPISRVELLARMSTHLTLLEAHRRVAGSMIRRTLELDARNAELVGWDNIVAAINREIELGAVLQALADQALHLVPRAEITSFFLKQDTGYRIVASAGYDHALVADVCFSEADVMARYLGGLSREQGLNRSRIQRNPGVFGALQDLPVPRAIISIPIVLEDVLEGFLVLSSLQDAAAFDEVDMRTVNRFREHGITALAKARGLERMRRQNQELLVTQQQLIMQEKMASLGTLTAGVAHEINNPTAFAHGSAQNLEVDLDQFERYLFDIAGEGEDSAIMADLRRRLHDLRAHVGTIKEGTSRIKGIVMNLQTFARSDEAEVRWASLSDGVQSTLDLVKTHFKDRITFTCTFHDRLHMECRPLALNQVFLNLIVNACEAMVEHQTDPDARGTLTIETRREGDEAVMTFADTGPGMPEEVRRRVFEPFFTTKPVGKGTGLGLSMSYGVVQKHGGTLSVTSQPGEGTCFTLRLPMQAADTAPDDHGAPHPDGL